MQTVSKEVLQTSLYEACKLSVVLGGHPMDYTLVQPRPMAF